MILSKNQVAIDIAFNKSKQNLNISAVAGSGKTTTLLHLLKSVPEGKSCLFLAFNNSIVNELKNRIGIKNNIDVMTTHSFGWRSILNRYGKVKMSPSKSVEKTYLVIKKYHPDLMKKLGYHFYIVPEIIDLLRCNLLNNDRDSVDWIVDRYGYDITLDKTYDVIKRVFDSSVRDLQTYDFMDMLYRPIIDKTINIRRYDYVFCDESQDFSILQHALIKRAISSRGGRIITVGDEYQAIYGFAGADADSYGKLKNINGNSISLPLSVSYRCSKNVIKEAQKYVNHIRHKPDAEDGKVFYDGSLLSIKDGDWILCRNLKPLIKAYIWLLKNKIKSKIRGRDIGSSLLTLIHRTHAKTISTMIKNLENEKFKLYDKLSNKGVFNPTKHAKYEELLEKIEVIEYLSYEARNVIELCNMIENIFTDEVEGILLSTIHKSKGLENDTIFFLCPELIPSVYATQSWELIQERNLKYVAITRAKKNLVYVNGNQFSNDLTKNIKL